MFCATSQYRCSVYANDVREIIPILNSQAIGDRAAPLLANNLSASYTPKVTYIVAIIPRVGSLISRLR
jgi:hypothetical protein